LRTSHGQDDVWWAMTKVQVASVVMDGGWKG
jgi:hypothetical protein